jgi:hypothetical protein
MWYPNIKPLPVSEPATWSTGDVEIAGSLFKADGERPRPAIVFMTGSGGSPALEIGVVRAHVRNLTAAGYAVLVFDRRGTGASGGTFRDWTFQDLASDLNGAYEWLAKQPGVDADRIGTVAISQGWWISVQAAQQSDINRFIVGIGAPATTPAEQEEWVLESEMRSAGFNESTAPAIGLLRMRNNVLRGTVSKEAYEHEQTAYNDERWYITLKHWFTLGDGNHPYWQWYRGIFDYNPVDDIRALNAPLAVFQGENDVLVDPKKTVATYNKLAREGVDVDVFSLPNVGHDLSNRVTLPILHNKAFPRQWPRRYWNELESWLQTKGFADS